MVCYGAQTGLSSARSGRSAGVYSFHRCGQFRRRRSQPAVVIKAGNSTLGRSKIRYRSSRIVDKMFALAETGEGQSVPFGVKNIVNWLHAKGYRTRTGHAWHVQTVYSILTGTIYNGIHWFNTTDSKTREPRPFEEHVSVEMPAIIETGRWERVQEILRSKNPKVSSPKVITGPILLTRLVRCESCGYAMTLRTGGLGAYRYHTCAGDSRAALLSAKACRSRWISSILQLPIVLSKSCCSQ
jgi:site-specific DNA recombinase